jgi:hypothetical protein
MVEWGTFIIKIASTYYLKFAIDLITGGYGILKTKNEEMEEYRKKPFKSIDEQKEFLDKKYPYRTFRFSWKGTIDFLITILYFMLLYFIVDKIFVFFKVSVALWISIIVLMFFPLLLNMFLRRYHLQTDTLSNILRWKR